VRARRDMVAHRVAACNLLRAHLAVAFPPAVGLFYELDSPISLAFMARYGSHDAVAQRYSPHTLPSAQPTLVRTQHLPRKSPGQSR